MPTSKQAVTHDVEGYRLLLELWRREKSLARVEFLGLLIATVILALVSLSGTWWPPLFGFAVSLVWLAAAARSLGQQDHLYGELELVSQEKGDNPVFRVHRLAQAEGPLPVVDKTSHWVRLTSRHFFVGMPAVLVVAWFAGFIVSLAT